LSWLLVPGRLQPELDGAAILVLLYLGLLASGLGFFLWNIGVTRVAAGTLAVFNNVKIPLAVLVSLLFFAEQTELLRLVMGGALIMLALAMNTRPGKNKSRS
jgi:drug/metabolite transporter (DMT)-like permease